MNKNDISVRILIVDDDEKIRDLLKRYLSREQMIVFTAADGVEMDACLNRQRVDLIVLDLMLPGEGGLSIAKRLSANQVAPIIMLSARGEETDRIVGLEVGADDYLPKPFNPRELLARIRAVLRRQRPTEHGEPHEAKPDVYTFGEFRLDVANNRLLHRTEEIDLTSGEFALLEVLVRHPNRVLSRDQLVDMIKGYDRSPFDRSIDVRVTRLRRKIEEAPARPRYLRTVWGKGYLFTPNSDAEVR